MSVVIETTLGDLTVDLFLNERPRACLNFLKLCKVKYYNYNLFHTISRGFIAQTGDPTGSRSGGESVFGLLDGPLKRYFEGENEPRIKHTKMGLISFVGNEDRMIGSQFFLTLGEDLTYLDEKHCVFGEVVEGFDILEIINEVICDTDDRPYQDLRITHTVILDDPYPDPRRLVVPSRSPSPSAERLQGGRIAPDEEIDDLEGKTAEEIAETQADREAKARATILEMVGDLPDAEMAPPENVLFVCKLNPVTNDDDLEIIFSRFGKIKSCEVIRDKKTGDSLQYAFVEFDNQKACEDAYFKMDNVLIDDRRIHVDFSQSVSKVRWHGKGRGVTHYDETGKKSRANNDIGKGDYKHKNNDNRNKRPSDRSRSPKSNRDNYRKIDKKESNHRDNSLSPKRKREFNSPSRRDTRNRDYRSTKDTERSSRRNRDRSVSPRRRESSPSPRKYREYSSSARNESRESRYYQGNRRRHENKSESARNSDKSSKYDNVTSTYSSVFEKGSFKRYSPGEKRNSDAKSVTNKSKLKSKNRRRSHSDSEPESKKNKKKKLKHSSSEDSDSSDNKKIKKGKSSSDSSDSSECETKKKKHKSVKKDRYNSGSDSDHYKSKKSKKKRKKYDSDSD